MEELREALKTEDNERIKKAHEEMVQASHRLAEMMYQQAGGEGAPGAEAPPGAGTPPPGAGAPPADDVIDADFEEV